MEKLKAREEEAIKAAEKAGGLFEFHDGDAAVLFDIRRANPHIGAVSAGWKDLSPTSDLSKVQLGGVTVNSTGQVTKLDLGSLQLTGENSCSTNRASDPSRTCACSAAVHDRQFEGARVPQRAAKFAARSAIM